jgi:hypothetical protein
LTATTARRPPEEMLTELSVLPEKAATSCGESCDPGPIEDALGAVVLGITELEHGGYIAVSPRLRQARAKLEKAETLRQLFGGKKKP